MMKIKNMETHTIILRLACLLLPFVGQAAETASYQPIRGLADLSAIEDMPRLRDGVGYGMASSYDRSGGNSDGFTGKYSTIRKEGKLNHVIAEMEGAGVIQRIWFPFTRENDRDVLGLESPDVRLQIYLDGASTPQIDVPPRELFLGDVPGFPEPLVSKGKGGMVSYTPIAYRNGAKVVIANTKKVLFYQIQYVTLDEPGELKTFTPEAITGQQAELERFATMWNNPGDLGAFGIPAADREVLSFDLKGNTGETIPLPDGAHMIRGVYFKAADGSARPQFQFFWDGSGQAAVDVPGDYFFAQAPNGENYQSMLTGTGSDELGNYNFIPMPYKQSAILKLKGEGTINGKLTLVLQKNPEHLDEMGYLHALYREELPTTRDQLYVFANHKGRGHYIGAFFTMDREEQPFPKNAKGVPSYMKAPYPFWLEGDEVFTVDGVEVAHGTGTEDYINAGWYGVPGRLDSPGGSPLAAFTAYAPNVKETHHTAAFRWHHPGEAIPYDDTFNATVEVGPTSNTIQNYRSVAWFYDVSKSRIPYEPIVIKSEKKRKAKAKKKN